MCLCGTDPFKADESLRVPFAARGGVSVTPGPNENSPHFQMRVPDVRHKPVPAGRLPPGVSPDIAFGIGFVTLPVPIIQTNILPADCLGSSHLSRRLLRRLVRRSFSEDGSLAEDGSAERRRVIHGSGIFNAFLPWHASVLPHQTIFVNQQTRNVLG
jgi:hypothetical protein